MKINVKKLVIITAAVVLVLAIPFIVFHARSPVLILTELSFILLYGEDRISQESSRASLTLFRPVRTVVVANDAGDDIIQVAIADVSSKPFCVLFPLRFASAGAIYQQHNPNVRVVILAGRHSAENIPPAGQIGYFIYKTDIEADFFRAGIAAAALDTGNNGRIALFVEPYIQLQSEEAFLRGINDQGKQLETHLFASYSDFFGVFDLSCVVVAGVGAEYLEEYSDVPVIFFSWLNPSLISADVFLIINDSPWAQAVQAVTLASAEQRDGLIRSKFIVLDRRNIDRRILRKISIDS